MVRRMLHDYFNWKEDFEETYLEEIKYYCLILSENYIKQHFEKRLDDT